MVSWFLEGCVAFPSEFGFGNGGPFLLQCLPLQGGGSERMSMAKR
jgi:hypothetical protein